MSPANRCPRCGSTVSQFAAGCAVCGADLETLRRTRRARPAGAPGLPGLGRIGQSASGRELAEDVAVALLMAVIALFAPLYGVVFSALIVWDSQRRGRLIRRNLTGGCLALALLALFGPQLGLPHLGPDWSQL